MSRHQKHIIHDCRPYHTSLSQVRRVLRTIGVRRGGPCRTKRLRHGKTQARILPWGREAGKRMPPSLERVDLVHVHRRSASEAKRPRPDTGAVRIDMDHTRAWATNAACRSKVLANQVGTTHEFTRNITDSTPRPDKATRYITPLLQQFSRA